jgi:hypothetical protein
MLRIVSVVLGSGVLIACGVVHGVWTERFQPSAAVQNAVEKLPQLPLNLGPEVDGRPQWQGEEIPVKPGSAVAGVAGCLQRSYTDTRSGKVVTIALVCGRPGPVSIHSPDACYAASGYTVDAPREVKAAGGAFWKADALLTRAGGEEHRLRIFWAWNNGGGWKANADPRREYVSSPALFKLYVLRALDAGEEPNKAEPCQELMKALLPALDKTLFASES